MRPTGHWQSDVEKLLTEHQNFTPLIQSIVWPHVAMLARGLSHRLPPVLLNGPAGVGKTRFARSLCSLLNVPPPLVISLAEENNGSALAGSSVFWSNSAPGKLFETLAWRQHTHDAVANPLIVLDEIDKVSATQYDPVGALYRLLEEDTASVFVDQSLPDVLIDTRHVRFIATANDASKVPEPLRSRMVIYNVPTPTPEQAHAIVLSMVQHAVAKHGHLLSAEVPHEVMKHALKLSPREVRIRIDCAVALAICHQRQHLTLDDWIQAALVSTVVRTQLGFL